MCALIRTLYVAPGPLLTPPLAGAAVITVTRLGYAAFGPAEKSCLIVCTLARLPGMLPPLPKPMGTNVS